jgi:maleylpyruvate isomerase
MTGSNTSANTMNGISAVDAENTLTAVRDATAVVIGVVERFGEADFTTPSLLPGWSRGHVVSHLARNADALVNLLSWARTGIEHPAYPSRVDREAGINSGADRLGQVQREDLVAASGRFLVEAARLSESDWAALVQHPSGHPMAAAEIPSTRLFEVWTHLVDLDAGVGFDAVVPGHFDALLDRAVRPYLRRTDGTAVRVHAELPDGSQREWDLAVGTEADTVLRGPASAVLAWLTGRPGSSALDGTPPDLGAWG